MYLHHMTISAIGPFQHEHQIDFSALSAAGLFLLEGATGAGKSTIIDAIVYALYGSVASSATSDDRMRSDHASDSVESFVDLIFETSHGIFRVVRQPERMRPKKRGTGLTKQQTKVVLFKLSVADLEAISAQFAAGATHEEVNNLALGEHRSSRADEIGSEISRAIGLSRTQFVQTIVLPQGEFAQFLRSDPEQRRTLLQNVFGTEIYERAQEQLAAMKREAMKTIEAADGNRRDAIRAFVQASGNPEVHADALVSFQDDILIESIQAEVSRLTEKEAAAQDIALQAFTSETRAKEALDSAKLLVASFELREKLLAEKLLLAELQPEIEHERLRQEQATRAAFVLPLDDAAKRAQRELDDSLGKFVSAVEVAQEFAEIGPVNGDKNTSGRDTVSVFADAFMQQRSSIEEQSRQAQELRGQLAELERLEASLPAKAAVIEREEERQREQRVKGEEVTKLLAARPSELKVLLDERDTATVASSKIPSLEAAQKQNQVLVSLVEQLEVSLADAEAASNAVAQSLTATQQAATKESQMRESWLGQLAGTVAAALVDGKPCAACGSIEHPNPATIDPGAATQEQVELAESERQSAQTLLSNAQSKHAAAVARVQEQQESLAGATKEQIEADALRIRSDLESAQANAKLVRELNQRILEFETHTGALIQQDKQLSSEAATLEGRISELKTQYSADLGLVASTISEHSRLFGLDSDGKLENLSLRDISRHAENKSQALGVLLRRLDEYLNASRRNAERAQELNEMLKDKGFGSAQEARDVSVDPDDLRALSQKIQVHDVRVASVEDQLNSKELASVPAELKVDLDELRELYSGAQNKARQESHLATAARKTLQDASMRADGVQQILVELGEKRAKVQPIIRMADIASGNSSDNEKSISLATYVLMRRFEEVVEAANARLLVLSDGRFELVRSDQKEDVRSRKMGLALQVVDHDTEKPRDPRTLSGGETFNASLSLALGLADVVTAEAGGIELGTLFIDEGFGTLDPESLEKVISVLGGLREGGRAVGVVSHVETLKQAIPDGISVRRLSNGSSTLTVRA